MTCTKLTEVIAATCMLFSDTAFVAMSEFDAIGTVLFVSRPTSYEPPSISVRLGTEGDTSWALLVARQIYEACDRKQLVLTLAVKKVDRELLVRAVDFVRGVVASTPRAHAKEAA